MDHTKMADGSNGSRLVAFESDNGSSFGYQRMWKRLNDTDFTSMIPGSVGSCKIKSSFMDEQPPWLRWEQIYCLILCESKEHAWIWTLSTFHSHNREDIRCSALCLLFYFPLWWPYRCDRRHIYYVHCDQRDLPRWHHTMETCSDGLKIGKLISRKWETWSSIMMGLSTGQSASLNPANREQKTGQLPLYIALN